MKHVNRVIRTSADYFDVSPDSIVSFSGLDRANFFKQWEGLRGYRLRSALKAGTAIIAIASRRYDSLDQRDRRKLEMLLDEIIAAYVEDELGR